MGEGTLLTVHTCGGVELCYSMCSLLSWRHYNFACLCFCAFYCFILDCVLTMLASCLTWQLGSLEKGAGQNKQANHGKLNCGFPFSVQLHLFGRDHDLIVFDR